jgi:hypothetical protein
MATELGPQPLIQHNALRTTFKHYPTIQHLPRRWYSQQPQENAQQQQGKLVERKPFEEDDEHKVDPTERLNARDKVAYEETDMKHDYAKLRERYEEQLKDRPITLREIEEIQESKKHKSWRDKKEKYFTYGVTVLTFLFSITYLGFFGQVKEAKKDYKNQKLVMESKYRERKERVDLLTRLIAEHLHENVIWDGTNVQLVPFATTPTPTPTPTPPPSQGLSSKVTERTLQTEETLPTEEKSPEKREVKKRVVRRRKKQEDLDDIGLDETDEINVFK